MHLYRDTAQPCVCVIPIGQTVIICWGEGSRGLQLIEEKIVKVKRGGDSVKADIAATDAGATFKFSLIFWLGFTILAS